MTTDFVKFINFVGLNKVKEDLKVSLQEATIKENWNLVQEITNFIETDLPERHDNPDGFMENILERDVWVRLKFILVENLEMDEKELEIIEHCCNLSLPISKKQKTRSQLEYWYQEAKNWFHSGFDNFCSFHDNFYYSYL